MKMWLFQACVPRTDEVQAWVEYIDGLSVSVETKRCAQLALADLEEPRCDLLIRACETRAESQVLEWCRGCVRVLDGRWREVVVPAMPQRPEV